MKTEHQILLVGGGLLALYAFTRKTSGTSSVVEQAAANVGNSAGALLPQSVFSFVGGFVPSFVNTSYQSGFSAGETVNQALRGAASPAQVASKINLPSNYNSLPRDAQIREWETQYQNTINPLINVPILSSATVLWHAFLTRGS